MITRATMVGDYLPISSLSHHGAADTDRRSLEERRILLKDKLSKDEGALFEIANRYDLRHRRQINAATTMKPFWTGSSGGT